MPISAKPRRTLERRATAREGEAADEREVRTQGLDPNSGSLPVPELETPSPRTARTSLFDGTPRSSHAARGFPER